MYITCPSCSTSYEVDGTQIGPQGRAVRCFNCHHSWHQYPVAPPPPSRPAPPPQSARYVPRPAYAEPAYMPEPAYAAPRQAMSYAMPPQAMPMAAAYAQPVAPEPMEMPEPAPRPEPVKAAPPPPPPPEPVPAPKPVAPPPPVEEMPSDDDLDKMLGAIRDEAASKAFGSGGGRDDTTDIDEEKIAKLPDPEPLRPVYGGKEAADDDLDDDIEPDEIPDPDPIPAVYGGADEDDDEDLDEKGGGIRRLIAPAITIVAVGAIVAGLFVARDYVVKYVPMANDYLYDLVGLHVMVPGEGLKRELTRTAMETVAEVDHVIATGLITNVSDKEQPLPQVVVQLIDANEKVLSSKTMTLEKATLQPGEVLQFKAVFDGAPATARKVRTEWGGFAAAAPSGQPKAE